MFHIIFGVVLNICNGVAMACGVTMAALCFSFKPKIMFPLGMDQLELTKTDVSILGCSGVVIGATTLFGFLFFNLNNKKRKVFLAFPFTFLFLVTLGASIALFSIKSAADSEMRELFDRCCKEYEECCVKSKEDKKFMDDVHHDYKCCGFDGPEYFIKLKRRFPQSCCEEKDTKKGYYTCDEKESYNASCKSQIDAKMLPYLVPVGTAGFFTTIVLGVLITLIAFMGWRNLYMTKSKS